MPSSSLLILALVWGFSVLSDAMSTVHGGLTVHVYVTSRSTGKTGQENCTRVEDQCSLARGLESVMEIGHEAFCTNFCAFVVHVLGGEYFVGLETANVTERINASSLEFVVEEEATIAVCFEN